jgi:hypothetical protein
MSSAELTADPPLVGSPEDLRSLTQSLEKAVHMVRQFSKPLDQAARVFQQAGSKETIEKWGAVKPMFESAPPHEKRRLGRMTIEQAFTFYSRRASTRARANLHHGAMHIIGGRVRAAARAPRRSIRSSSAKARAPGSSSDDDPSDGAKGNACGSAAAGYGEIVGVSSESF